MRLIEFEFMIPDEMTYKLPTYFHVYSSLKRQNSKKANNMSNHLPHKNFVSFNRNCWKHIFLKYNKAEHSEWQYNFSQILSHWSFQSLSRQKKIGHFDLVFIVDNKYSKASWLPSDRTSNIAAHNNNSMEYHKA